MLAGCASKGAGKVSGGGCSTRSSPLSSECQHASTAYRRIPSPGKQEQELERGGSSDGSERRSLSPELLRALKGFLSGSSSKVPGTKSSGKRSKVGKISALQSKLNLEAAVEAVHRDRQRQYSPVAAASA